VVFRAPIQDTVTGDCSEQPLEKFVADLDRYYSLNDVEVDETLAMVRKHVAVCPSSICCASETSPGAKSVSSYCTMPRGSADGAQNRISVPGVFQMLVLSFCMFVRLQMVFSGKSVKFTLPI